MGAERPRALQLLCVRLPGGAGARQGYLHGRAVLPQRDANAGTAAIRPDDCLHRRQLLRTLASVSGKDYELHCLEFFMIVEKNFHP